MTGLTSQKSFTLIELLTVMAVIGILVLIGMPALRNFQPTLQLNGIVRGLMSNLRLTQQLAISEQLEYCLVLPDSFPSNREYQIIQCDQMEPFKQELIPEEITGLSIVPSLSNNEVRYNPYGSVKESAQIILENINNQTKTIDVRPSGFIRISD